MASTSTSTSTTALIVADVQVGIVQMSLKTEEAIKAYIAHVNQAIAAARGRNMLVVFIRVAFRAGHPEVGPNNKFFSTAKANNLFVDGTDATVLHPDLDVCGTDVVLTKCRFGPFSSTQLRTILTGNGIQAFAIAGIATGGVVLNAVTEGADMDYAITVLSDACADADSVIHDVLMHHVFPRRAYVETVANWIASLPAAK